MSFMLIKELMDRFIEFLLKHSKGETAEDALTSLIKNMIYALTINFVIILSGGIKFYDQMVEIKQLTIVSKKVNELMGEDSHLVRISQSQNEVVKQLATMNEERTMLMMAVMDLTKENAWLTASFKRMAATNELLKKNNDTLIYICKSGINKK